MFFDFLQNGFFIGTPCSVNPILYVAWANSNEPRPLGNCFCFSINYDSMIRAFVVCLLQFNRPLAIFRRVGAVVIDSLKRVFWAGPMAHISNETRKIVRTASSLANRDSASTVSGMRKNMASFTHTSPDSPFVGVAHPMGSVNLGRNLWLKATAGLRIAASEFIGIHDYFFSAFALAEPSGRWPALVSRTFGFGCLFRSAFNNFQLPVSVTCQIHEFWHVGGRYV